MISADRRQAALSKRTTKVPVQIGRRIMKPSRPVSLALALLSIASLGGGLHALAQQAVASATLVGRVEDTSGAAISGASIAITSVDKNQTRLSTTDEHGRYSFLYLPVGSYQLRVAHDGFSPVVRDLTLSVGQAMDLAVKLPIAGLTETANVSSVPVV